MSIILWAHSAPSSERMRSFLEGCGFDDIVDLSFQDLAGINRLFFEQASAATVLVIDVRLGVEARARWCAFLAGLCGQRRLICLVEGGERTAESLLAREDIEQDLRADLGMLGELAPELSVFSLQMQDDDGRADAHDALSWKDALYALRADVVREREDMDSLEESDQFALHVHWQGQEDMIPGRRFILRSATGKEAHAEVLEVGKVWSPPGLQARAAKGLRHGDVGYCKLATDRVVSYLPARRNARFAHVSLYERKEGNLTRLAGHGYIKHALRRASNIRWQALKVSKSDRAEQKGQKPCVLWFTGLSGAGKSTIAATVDRMLHDMGHHAFVLDGDNVRHGLCKDLGFTKEDRVENIRRVAEVARLMVDAGLIVIVSLISPFEEDRRNARRRFCQGEFYEIFIDTPLDVCETRDPKGLYRKARKGLIRNFTGIDSPFEKPASPDLALDGSSMSPEEAAKIILDLLHKRGHIAVRHEA